MYCIYCHRQVQASVVLPQRYIFLAQMLIKFLIIWNRHGVRHECSMMAERLPMDFAKPHSCSRSFACGQPGSPRRAHCREHGWAWDQSASGWWSRRRFSWHRTRSRPGSAEVDAVSSFNKGVSTVAGGKLKSARSQWLNRYIMNWLLSWKISRHSRSPAWAWSCVPIAIIFTALLLAPTVPSLPSP